MKNSQRIRNNKEKNGTKKLARARQNYRHHNSFALIHVPRKNKKIEKSNLGSCNMPAGASCPRGQAVQHIPVGHEISNYFNVVIGSHKGTPKTLGELPCSEVHRCTAQAETLLEAGKALGAAKRPRTSSLGAW